MSDSSPMRALPQTEAVLRHPLLATVLASHRREVMLRLVRAELDELRERLARGDSIHADLLTAEALTAATLARLHAIEDSQLRRVINATGVLLHTNLGRSVLGARAREALLAAAGGYCDLELDLASGKRSQRDKSVEPLLCALTGAEAATVVNNCAAAVYLVLYTLARRREVVTSRGELVEIGGNFRVPDVVRASGCKLVEVGTTNRTRFADYAAAVTPRTALLLKTHQSNYRIRGFTEEASLAELAGLAREHAIPLVFDAGSGLLGRDAALQRPPEGELEMPVNLATQRMLQSSLPTGNEPSIPNAIAAGANLVCFSGDKLLGGPQAGIICGDAALIARLRKSPLWRALRVDKLTLAALGATLAEQLRQPGRGLGGGMPLLAEQLQDQAGKAQSLALLLRGVQPRWQFECVEIEGSYGGGALADESFPGWAVAVRPRGMSAEQLDAALRGGAPAVLGLLQRGRYCLHTAALLPDDAVQLAQRFKGLGDG